MSVACPMRGRISVLTSLLDVTGEPSIDTIRSIGCRPAVAAGVPGWPSHDVVAATSVTGTTHLATEATSEPWPGTGAPCIVIIRVSRTVAMTRFISGPPSMTAILRGVVSL